MIKTLDDAGLIELTHYDCDQWIEPLKVDLTRDEIMECVRNVVDTNRLPEPLDAPDPEPTPLMGGGPGRAAPCNPQGTPPVPSLCLGPKWRRE